MTFGWDVAAVVVGSIVFALLVIFWKRIRDWWGRRRRSRHPEQLSPPTPEQLVEVIDFDRWGDRQYEAAMANLVS